MSVSPAQAAVPPNPPVEEEAVVVADGGGVVDATAAAAAAQAAGPARMNVRALFDEHYEFVWRSLRRLGVSEADVDDAAQEVFVIVHRKLHEFAARSKVTTWLYGICFRVASEHHRRAYVRHEEPTDAPPDRADEAAASPEERYAGREAREKLDEVLAALDADKRAVFVLYEIDQLPVEQIAAMVGVPVGTVYSRLKAAREEFERSLARMKARWARQARGVR